MVASQVRSRKLVSAGIIEQDLPNGGTGSDLSLALLRLSDYFLTEEGQYATVLSISIERTSDNTFLQTVVDGV